MAHRIEWKPSAARAFKKLPRRDQARIGACIDGLATEPRPDGVKKLQGDDNAWRIRVGAYRVVYEIHDAVLVVMVLRVANRRDAYR